MFFNELNKPNHQNDGSLFLSLFFFCVWNTLIVLSRSALLYQHSEGLRGQPEL